MKKLNKSRSLSASKQNIIALSVIGIFALLLLRGAFYSIATPDESFYLTIPYRIILGDALLIDEWHASQLSAFLLYLPMKLFIMLTGGTDGIVVFFRCLFVLCQAAVSCFTYVKLKKYGFIPALFSALLFLTYVVEQVHMLDYYTMTLMGFQVVSLLFLTDERHTIPKLIFIGITFACTVTAQPFNSLVYFIYSALVLIFFFIGKKKEYSEFTKRLLSLKCWCFITAGIVLTAVIFIAFLAAQAPLGEIFGSIGNLFSGQDHNLPFSQEADSDMFSYLTIAKTLLSLAPICFLISLLLLLGILADKKRSQHKRLWLYISIAVFTVYLAALAIKATENPTALLFRPYPLFLFTLIIILLKKEPCRELFAIWLTGVVYIAFLGIVSQALDYVGAVGCVLSNTALMPAVKQLYDELKEESKSRSEKSKEKILLTKALAFVPMLLCFLVIITGGALEFSNDVYAQAMGRIPEKAVVTLSEGPLKGIKTGKSVSEDYTALLGDINEIKENSDGKVLVAGLIPWTYFCFDEPPAAFTTWYISNELYMYDSYYEDEAHRPVCIYVPKTSFYWGADNTSAGRQHLLYFKNMFSGTTKTGKAGTLFYIDKMR